MKVHPTYGPRLMHHQRHHYTPLNEEQKNERDPSDPVKISFTVPDEELNDWFDARLKILQEYDPMFWVNTIATRNGTIYQISTFQHHLHSNEYKKFMFQVKLKLGKDVNVR